MKNRACQYFNRSDNVGQTIKQHRSSASAT